jgi:hypothetical protein
MTENETRVDLITHTTGAANERRQGAAIGSRDLLWQRQEM